MSNSQLRNPPLIPLAILDRPLHNAVPIPTRVRRVRAREPPPRPVRLHLRKVQRHVPGAHDALPQVVDAVVLVAGAGEAGLGVLRVLYYYVADYALEREEG